MSSKSRRVSLFYLQSPSVTETETREEDNHKLTDVSVEKSGHAVLPAAKIPGILWRVIPRQWPAYILSTLARQSAQWRISWRARSWETSKARCWECLGGFSTLQRDPAHSQAEEIQRIPQNDRFECLGSCGGLPSSTHSFTLFVKRLSPSGFSKFEIRICFFQVEIRTNFFWRVLTDQSPPSHWGDHTENIWISKDSRDSRLFLEILWDFWYKFGWYPIYTGSFRDIETT